MSVAALGAGPTGMPPPSPPPMPMPMGGQMMGQGVPLSLMQMLRMRIGAQRPPMPPMSPYNGGVGIY